jgi:hypothetical protein
MGDQVEATGWRHDTHWHHGILWYVTATGAPPLKKRSWNYDGLRGEVQALS